VETRTSGSAVGGWGNTPVGRPEGAPCPYYNHSSYMGDLLTNAAGLFAARQRRLAQELRGRKPSPLMQGLQMSFEELLNEERT